MPPSLLSRLLAAVAAIFVLLAFGPTALAEKVKEIIVVENTKTTDDTVRYITGIEEGDDWNEDIQVEVKRRLVSSGLFKDVELFSEPHPKGGGVRVTVIARDKHSWVIAPTFYNQPTNTGGGVGFGENNLFGENKKLLLYGQVATGDTFFVGAYIDPSIGGTRFSWAYDVFLRYERVIEYNAPEKFIGSVDKVRQSKMMYLNSGLKLGMTLFRKLKFEQRIRGAKMAFYKNQLVEDATLEDVCGDEPCTRAPEPGAEGWDISTESVLTFDNRANWYGVTSGSKFSLAYETALPSLGSDFDYWYATLNYERARRYFSRHNFIIKTKLGMGQDLPFQHEYTGGGTSLRGYKNKMFRGDFKVAANVEYSVPLFSIKGLGVRALTFWDSSYVAFLDIDEEERMLGGNRNYLPGHGELGLTPFKNSVGAGIRLYVRQIVLPLLGFDFGYGLESGSIETYLAIGLTD